MPSEPDRTAFRSTTSWLLLAGAVATALWLAELLPPWGGVPHMFASGVGSVRAAGVAGGVLVLWLAVTAALAVRVRELPPEPAMPILKPASLPPCRARRPVVTIAGLEAGAGATTLTFNLGVLLATRGGLLEDEGSAVAVRPVCLLAEGRLTAALGLKPGPLDELVASSDRLIPQLLDLAVHHPTGCELLCLTVRKDASPRRLVSVVDQLRMHYDAVLVDAAFGTDAVLDITAEIGELLLLVGLPTAASIEPSGGWAERVWAMRLERKTVVVVNRAGSGHQAPELTAGFLNVAQLADDRAVPDFDRLGLPWSLDLRLRAARQLHRTARRMFPSFLTGAEADAA